VTNNPQPLFTQITQREHALSRAELKSLGWKPALAASQKRQDAMAGLIASTLTPPLACKAGCSYCCHYKVGARAEEVFQIVDFVRTKFSAPRLQRLQEDVARNAATMRVKTSAEQLAANLPCPLLDNGQCSVYAVRPASCRKFHATDVAGCKQSFDEPENLAIAHSMVPGLLHTGNAHVKGLRQAFADAGYDGNTYELNAALAAALSDGTPKRRFEKHKKAFV
jgi:Fe-S-cluster containining protein